MLGTCPNCKIKLKEPPFNDRETNEMLLVLNYRKMVENNIIPRSIEELGFCELCKAKKQDIQKQYQVIRVNS